MSFKNNHPPHSIAKGGRLFVGEDHNIGNFLLAFCKNMGMAYKTLTARLAHKSTVTKSSSTKEHRRIIFCGRLTIRHIYDKILFKKNTKERS